MFDFKVDARFLSDCDADLLLRLWSVVLHLLSDQDSEIRALCDSIISSCPSSKEMISFPSFLMTKASREKKLFTCIHSKFEGKLIYMQHLLRVIFDENEAKHPVLNFGNGRLFDIEAEISHDERLLISGLAAEHALGQISLHVDWAIKWFSSLMQTFSQELPEFKTQSNTLLWTGQLANHGESFTILCRRLMGIWLLLKSEIDITGMNSILEQLLWECQNLKLHPYLRDMLESIETQKSR